MALLNPNTRTCPIFRTRRDAELTKSVYKRVPILIDENRKRGGNPWEIKFLRMFDQTNDAEHFCEAAEWQRQGYKREGNVYRKAKKRALPLYEAKMVQAFDHRAASVTVEEENWVRQGQKAETTPVRAPEPRVLRAAALVGGRGSGGRRCRGPQSRLAIGLQRRDQRHERTHDDRRVPSLDRHRKLRTAAVSRPEHRAASRMLPAGEPQRAGLRLRGPAEGRQCASQLFHCRATPRSAAGDLCREVPLVEEGNA